MPDKFDTPSAQFLERKLSTILSADVAEFSRLMGEDEEQTLRVFRGHKKVFESVVAMPNGGSFRARWRRCGARRIFRRRCGRGTISCLPIVRCGFGSGSIWVTF